jgi:hypothetical protein
MFHIYIHIFPGHLGHAIDQAVTGFSLQWPGFDPRTKHMWFMVDKVALGQIFSKYSEFPCQFTLYQLLHIHLSSYHWCYTVSTLTVSLSNQLITRNMCHVMMFFQLQGICGVTQKKVKSKIVQTEMCASQNVHSQNKSKSGLCQWTTLQRNTESWTLLHKYQSCFLWGWKVIFSDWIYYLGIHVQVGQ